MNSLIFSEQDFVVVGVIIQVDGPFVDAFDLPALLGVDPGVGFGFVGTAHTLDDAAAQMEAVLG